MKLFQVKEPLEVVTCNLSGSTFNDVNLAEVVIENVNLTNARIEDVNCTGLRLTNANLTDVSIGHGNFKGMTIEGVLVTDLLAAYEALQTIAKQLNKSPS